MTLRRAISEAGPGGLIGRTLSLDNGMSFNVVCIGIGGELTSPDVDDVNNGVPFKPDENGGLDAGGWLVLPMNRLFAICGDPVVAFLGASLLLHAHATGFEPTDDELIFAANEHLAAAMADPTVGG